MVATREWGLWSAIKLRTLEDYLYRFTKVTQGKTRHVVYLDLFAGRPSNTIRATGERLDGSPVIALRNTPPFTRLAFCEMPAQAAALDAELSQMFPGDKRFTVYPGDCNVTIARVLGDLKAISWAPTFAFVDPDGPHCRWSTVEALARHKPSTSRTKVELWLLFPTMFMRELPLAAGTSPTPEVVAQITAMYGIDQWELIYRDRLADRIDGAQARAEYVNLMRWRLEQALEYKATHAIDIPNEHGAPIYTMIFATDNDAGDRIMSSLYRKAAQQFPEMRIQAAEARKSKNEPEQISLLAPTPEQLPIGEYTHYPPWPPPGHIDI